MHPPRSIRALERAQQLLILISLINATHALTKTLYHEFTLLRARKRRQSFGISAPLTPTTNSSGKRHIKL